MPLLMLHLRLYIGLRSGTGTRKYNYKRLFSRLDQGPKLRFMMATTTSGSGSGSGSDDGNASGNGRPTSLQRAAKAIDEARALIITAGAGMGVDYGLPDFRGAQGFWKSYPLLKDKGINLSSMSNPEWFAKDPKFAWWFFAHRYNMYSSTTPHEGFHILKKWAERMSCGYFVFTSNVDGHFQKAGFDSDKVVECHGSINFMQCYSDDISTSIWPVPENTQYEIDNENLKLLSPLPTGPPRSEIQHPSRPNILMFGDWFWISDRTDAQNDRFSRFQTSLSVDGGIPFVVIEIGAGLGVPTVRLMSESLVGRNKGTLIRINPNEPEVPRWPKDNISLPMKGLEALKCLDELLNEK